VRLFENAALFPVTLDELIPPAHTVSVLDAFVEIVQMRRDFGIKQVNFWKVEIGRDRPFLEGGEANRWESTSCAKHKGHQRAGRRLTALALDVLSWNVSDFSRTMLGDIVVSQHALDVLRNANLSGFVVNPVRLNSYPAGVDRSKLPMLWEFIILGTGGRARRDSGIAILRKCGDCGLIEYSAFKNGIVVDPSSYNGADFFAVVEYPKYLLVSERAKSVIESTRLTNVRFIDSRGLTWPKGVRRPT
jgi:hypothetical protein